MGFMDILSSVGKFATEVLEEKAKEMQKNKKNFDQSYKRTSQQASQMSDDELRKKAKYLYENTKSYSSNYREKGERQAVFNEYKKRKEEHQKK